MDKGAAPEERQRFIRDQGIRYLHRAELSPHPTFERDQNRSPYFLENKEEFDHLAAVYGADLRKEAMAPVSIRFISDEVGFGLFAEEDLAPGALIGEYSGVVQLGEEVLGKPEETHFETDYTWDYPDAWYEDILFEINALHQGNELRYVNHSFEPNLVVEHTLLDQGWAIFFITEQFVRKDTQLTVDYGEEYWSGGFRELILF